MLSPQEKDSMEARNALHLTIRECLENAPPEHLEFALAALIEARFNVWPKAKADCVRRPNPPPPNSASIFEWWTDWSGQVSAEDTPNSPHSLNNRSEEHTSELQS